MIESMSGSTCTVLVEYKDVAVRCSRCLSLQHLEATCHTLPRASRQRRPRRGFRQKMQHTFTPATTTGPTSSDQDDIIITDVERALAPVNGDRFKYSCAATTHISPREAEHLYRAASYTFSNIFSCYSQAKLGTYADISP